MSRPALWVGVVAGLLIGALAWILLNSDQGTRGVNPPGRKSVPAAETRTPSTDPIAAEPASRAQPIKPRRFDAVEGRAEVQESQPTTGVRKLSVVIAPDDEPAAGALVEFRGFDSPETMPSSEADLDRVRPTELVADSSGVVLLPPFKLVAGVEARRGSLRGRTHVFAELPQDATLRLRSPVAVIVVDAAGSPQPDIPVALLDRVWSFEPLERGATDANGLALLVSPQDHGETYPRKQAEARKRSVALALPLSQPVEESFDPDRPPASPIKLTLPPTGRLVVKLVRPDGARFDEPAEVQVSCEDRDHIIGGIPFDGVSAAATDGISRFPWIGLGGRLRVRVVPGDQVLRATEQTFDGPGAAGAETIVTMTCGHLATNVSGRLVKPDGQPASKVMIFEAQLRRSGQQESMSVYDLLMYQRPAPDGRFKLHFDADPAGATEIELGIADELSLVGGVSEHRPRSLTMPLPESVKTGSVDLGEVVVVEAAFLAAGIVVSTEGDPVPFADIRAMQREKLWWVQGPHEIEGRTGPDGGFVLNGSTEEQGLGLIARADGWICVDPTPFEPGARDLKVVVTKAGGLAGWIKGIERGWGLYSDAPFSIHVTGAKVWSTARNAGGGRSGPLVLPVADDGVFRTFELLPGTYSVRFVAPGPTELLAIRGIEVVAGEVNRDSRLQDIDIGRLVTSRVVTVVDESEKPLAHAKIAAVIVKGGARKLSSAETGQDGRAVLATPAASVDIIVALKGYRAVTRQAVTGDVTVRLAKAAPRPVTIRLSDDVELPSPPFFISADLHWLCGLNQPRPDEPDWSDPRNHDSDDPPFGPERSVTVMVQDPGLYEVQLWLMEKENLRGSTGVGLDQRGGRPATVTVGEDGSASVTVRVDPDDLKREIAEAKKR